MKEKLMIIGFCLSLCIMSAFAEAIVTLNDGRILRGEIVAGIPPLMTFELETGETITLTTANIKVIYFRVEDDVVKQIVETKAGDTMVGSLKSLPPVITLKTVSGDLINLSPSNISYILFAISPGSQTVQTTAEPGFPSKVSRIGLKECIEDILEAYSKYNWRFSLGLGYFVGGLINVNELGYPSLAVGASLTLGAFWRWYIKPSKVEMKDRLGDCKPESLENYCEGISGLPECIKFTRFFYIQVGVDFLMLPGGGGGIAVKLGKSSWLDMGVVFNPAFTWRPPILPFIGVILSF